MDTDGGGVLSQEEVIGRGRDAGTADVRIPSGVKAGAGFIVGSQLPLGLGLQLGSIMIRVRIVVMAKLVCGMNGFPP